VRKQVLAGIDVVNDGEMSKPSYATYIKDRLHGFAGASHPIPYQDLNDFPELAKKVFGDPGRSRRKTPACNGPISVRDPNAAKIDVENLKAAVAKLNVEEAFISAASPGVVALFFHNVTIRARKHTCSPLLMRCAKNMNRWQPQASSYKSTAQTWRWAGISSTQTLA
jgi:hypothetical protein